jgi:hypothetical protein
VAIASAWPPIAMKPGSSITEPSYVIRYSSSASADAPTCATQISTSYGFCVSEKIAPSVWV